MSSEKYTPSLEDARQTYAYIRGGLDHDDGYAPFTQVHLEDFDRIIAEVRAEAWDEGASDGQWNLEHEGQIERGTRQPITNPYRENGDNNE